MKVWHRVLLRLDCVVDWVPASEIAHNLKRNPDVVRNMLNIDVTKGFARKKRVGPAKRNMEYQITDRGHKAVQYLAGRNPELAEEIRRLREQRREALGSYAT